MQLDLLEWKEPGAVAALTGSQETSNPLSLTEFDEGEFSTSRPSAQLRWNRANPEKIRAHAAVAAALKRGELVREGCFVEGCTAGADETQAHHRWYDRENWLNVVFLCPSHHRRWHAIARKCGVEL